MDLADLELMLQNLNSTATDERKFGLQKFLEALKNFYQFDTIHDSKPPNGSSLIRILFSNQLQLGELFAAISRLLRDPDWKIRKDSLEILIAIITKDILQDRFDQYFSTISKHLIKCVSDNIMTVRKSATQCFHEYLRRSSNFDHCLKDFIEFGLRAPMELSQRQDNNHALQVVLTANFAGHNFAELMVAVIHQLDHGDGDSDERLVAIVVSVLRSLHKLIGDERFVEYRLNLPANTAALYKRCSSAVEPSVGHSDESIDRERFATKKSFAPLTMATAVAANESVVCGFIPRSLIDDIEHDRKLEAIEQIHNLFRWAHAGAVGGGGGDKEIRTIVPHLGELLQLIQRLMEEDNYLVMVTAFKLLIDVVHCVPATAVDAHLAELLRLLRLVMVHNAAGGGADAIIQKYTMAYAMALFQRADTGDLLARMCGGQFMMDARQAAVRQGAIDVVISALLLFPSTKFDLDFLCGKVVQRLMDRKQKVKQAALECISVIGYNYGNGKISTLLKAVEQVSKGTDSSSDIPELVQARLSKHRLPHIDDRGIVVYATDNDKFTAQRQQSIIDLENSSSDNSPISSANPLEKRRPSAGKIRGRAKFPWDQNEGNCNTPKTVPLSMTPRWNSQNQILPSDIMPIQYSQGPLSITSKELLNEGRTIRKLNEILTNNGIDNNDRYSSENSSLISVHTSGYSTGSNSHRNNYEHLFKQNMDTGTATNSTTVTPRNNPPTYRFEDSAMENSPIPTKPALGRSAGSRRNSNPNSNDIIANEIVNTNNDNQNELINSPLLQGVRNSASKKKAMKLFNTSNPSSVSNNGEQEVNFIYSQTMPTNINKVQQENTNLQKVIEAQSIYNPLKGATFKSNPQYSTVVVGKGVVWPPIESNDPQPPRKKQPIKGLLETSSGNISQRLTMVNNSHNEIKKPIRNEFPEGHTTYSHSETPAISKNISRSSTIGAPVPDFNNEIIGRGLTEKINVEDDSDEEPNKGIMSNTLRESLSLKRQKVANELHSYKSENSIIPNTLSSYSAPGSGSHQAAHRKPPAGSYYHSNTMPSSAGNERDINNGYETVLPSRKPLRPALGNSTPKQIKPISQLASNMQSNSATESMSINPAPLNNPEKSINECLTLIQNEDWEMKIAAMNIIQSLLQFHSEMLITRSPDIHAIAIALCRECKNLRSQVAKCAIQTVGQLFIHLRKNMDSVLENIVTNLLSKAGEGTNSFLRQDVESTLALMIENVSPHRAFITLLQSGSDHKNIAIRRLTACNIMMLCERLGSVKTMSCIKEIPDKILPGIVKFSMDGNQETRYYGKKILFELNKNSDFEKLCNKHIQQKELRILKDILDNIKIKGIGDPPQYSHSAGMQRSGSLSRGASAGNLVALGSKSSPLSRGSSRSMTRLPGSDMSEDDKDWLTNTCSQLSSSDFRNRQIGLESILNKAELNGLELPQKGISRLLKEFIPRLNDNNTKVTVTALYICQKIIPYICSIFPTEFLSEFINTIALNFASKSNELREAASNVMNVCFANLDHSLLIQPCIEAINKSNPKTKPMLIENMNDLLSAIRISKVSPLNRSTGVIIRHLIPEIGHLLDKNRPLPPQLKESVHNLVFLTYEIVGQEMIDATAQRGEHNLKKAIIDILNMKN